jgi:hypothetical protein
MAAINVQKEQPAGLSKAVILFSWLTMGDDDTGDAIQIPGMADRTVTITGTFASATATIQGSNDNSVWFSCTDPQGNALAFTAAGMELIVENPRYLRVITAGGSGTDVDVIITSRSTFS